MNEKIQKDTLKSTYVRKILKTVLSNVNVISFEGNVVRVEVDDTTIQEVENILQEYYGTREGNRAPQGEEKTL